MSTNNNKKCPQWKTVMTINDHHDDGKLQEVYLCRDSRGRYIAAGRVGYMGHLCLNVMYQDGEQWHLSRTATCTATPEELRELQHIGEFQVIGMDGEVYIEYKMVSVHEDLAKAQVQAYG